MPFYDYRCCECGHTFEAMHGIDDRVEACERCGAAVKKLFNAVGIIFKGSGFYSTDYRSKSSTTTGGNGNGNGDKKEPPASNPDKTDTSAKEAAPAADMAGSATKTADKK
ncbi:MAG: FmdB family zinc ribbon protein [Candidatus Geothermincolia bacterium]